MNDRNLRQIARPVFTVILTVYVIAIFIVASPHSSFRDSFSEFVRPVLDYPGLYHSFWPFSPNPPEFNQRFDAVITLADGRVKIWTDFTARSRADINEQEVTVADRWRYLFWPVYWKSISSSQERLVDAARYLARLFNDAKNPPVLVRIYEEDIPTVCPLSGSGSGAERTKKQIAEYTVTAEDLK